MIVHVIFWIGWAVCTVLAARVSMRWVKDDRPSVRRAVVVASALVAFTWPLTLPVACLIWALDWMLKPFVGR